MNVTESATFVVDITKLRQEKDVLKDGFGKWNYSGSHPVPFHVAHREDGHIDIDRCAPGASGADVVYLRRLHAIKFIIPYIILPNLTLICLLVMQYIRHLVYYDTPWTIPGYQEWHGQLHFFLALGCY